jgi:predicted phosphodiesterase
MKILVISDLHIGIRARTKELCPYPEGESKDDKQVSSFLEVLKIYQNKNGDIDYLVIPGDITHQFNLAEYECGEIFLRKVLSELKMDDKRVIFVPGNHDVDWSVLEGATIQDNERKLRKRHKYNTLKDPDHLFSQLSSSSLVQDPFIKKWEFGDVVYFGFNSSWHDDSLQKNHYGLIELSQVALLKKMMESTVLENKLKVFVVHHHVYQYTNPHPSWREFSCMQNAQALLDLLSEFDFDFIIHGHRHVPFFSVINPNGNSMINLLCSGSYSCEVPSEIAGSVGNLYHIIEIDEKPCKGKVLSFAYDPTQYKWVESRDNHGISFINPFGNETPVSQLLNQCSHNLDNMGTDSEVIFFDKISAGIDDMQYLPIVKQEKLLKDIEAKYKLSRGIVKNKIIFLNEEK